LSQASFRKRSKVKKKQLKEFRKKSAFFQKSSESHAEAKLAVALDNLGVIFVQQYRINGYRVDFYVAPRLIVEVDGAIHILDVEAAEKDKRKDAFLKERGFIVHRYRDFQVRKPWQAEQVAKKIKSFREKITSV